MMRERPEKDSKSRQFPASEGGPKIAFMALMRHQALLATLVLGAALVTGSVTSSVGIDVTTYHNDNGRTGQNLSETTLTWANVNSGAFGKTAFLPTDGKVDAQPLYLSALSIPGQGARNMLYVATEHGSVYGFDADSGAVVWRASTLGAGETPSEAVFGCGQVTPEIGVTATPVIDRARGVIYVAAMSKNAAGSYFQRLHALDLTSGAEVLGGPRTIQATFPGSGAGSSGGVQTFNSKYYYERAGLLLVNGRLILTFTSHCDDDPYTGWILAYDPATLAQTGVLNVTPNGPTSGRGAIWMAGAGPAADAAGNVFLLDGNGDFDTVLDGNGFPSRGNFGNAFLKIATTGGLFVADYFATFNTVSQSAADVDLGSGGALVLPDLVDGSGRVRHLAVGAGKDTHLYVVDRDAMGKWSPSNNNNVYQDLSGALPGGVWSMPAYFNGTLYYGSNGAPLKAFPITNARVAAAPASLSARSFPYPGTTPGISASGTTNGIVWAVENANPAVLHAYDATNLAHELYNSTQAGSRDSFGAGNKFITPTIVSGRVFVGTQTGVAVFGSLASLAPAPPTNLRFVRGA